jgi:hydroxymethylpyrimidine pyrophosphatase-like HAD family hydrolase
MIIAIDFDGTVVTHEYPKVGRDIGAVPVLKKLVENGHRLILFTMRSPIAYIDDAIKWFDDNDIKLYSVNGNPTQNRWTTSSKTLAELYIDDAGLGIPLCYPDGERPYVDWIEVEKILKSKALL